MRPHLTVTQQTLMKMLRRSQLLLLVLREHVVPQTPAVLESKPRRKTRSPSPLRRPQLLRAMILQIQMTLQALMSRSSLRVRLSLLRRPQLPSQRRLLRKAQTLIQTAVMKMSQS